MSIFGNMSRQILRKVQWHMQFPQNVFVYLKILMNFFNHFNANLRNKQ